MERRGPTQRARQHEVKVNAEAAELVRICEYVEKSRIENPNPEVLTNMAKSLADLAAREHTLPLPLTDYVETYRIYEIFIRTLASSEKPMSPTTLFTATQLISPEAVKQMDMKSALWHLIDGPIVWTDKRNLALSPEVREQFK